jgi:translation initiation factor 3 subunit I
VLSGSADTNVKLWSAEHGKEIQTWSHRAPVRTVEYAYGDAQFLAVTDQVLGFLPAIYIWDTNGRSRSMR